MTSEVDDLITALHDGTMSLDEVAERFRHRSWPRNERPFPQTYAELTVEAQQDPEPLVPGSFDDLVVAYSAGKVTGHQYDVLATAIVDSMKAEDRLKAEESPGAAG